MIEKLDKYDLILISLFSLILVIKIFPSMKGNIKDALIDKAYAAKPYEYYQGDPKKPKSLRKIIQSIYGKRPILKSKEKSKRIVINYPFKEFDLGDKFLKKGHRKEALEFYKLSCNKKQKMGCIFYKTLQYAPKNSGYYKIIALYLDSYEQETQFKDFL